VEPTAVPAVKIQRTGDSEERRAANAEGLQRESSTAATGESTEPDLSGVLDKLQQVREIDPVAEQQLTAELRKSPPDSWPLVAEQFRDSLAYREQLRAKRRAPREGGRQVESRPRSDSDASQQTQTRLLSDTRPSAPIGQLVDPRAADADGISSEALARSTPYSMPAREQTIAQSAEEQASPVEFASDGPSFPIHSRTTVADAPSGNTPAVVQARFEAGDAPPDSRIVETNWQALLEMAAEDLRRRLAASPTTTAEVHQHVSLRMLYLLAGDTELALAPIPSVSPVEQDYWSRQLFALATYLDHHSQQDDKRRAAASVIYLDQAVSSLRELGALSVRNLSFCKNVYGYGELEPYEKDHFAPGQHVSMYVEVENYHSTPTDKGYRTSLGSSYEILAEDGTRVGGGEIPDIEDLCRSRRRDFHIQYGLTLPATLVPAKYRLQLLIKDRQSDKIGHASVAFEVRGAAR
jgi:hypothetical protein